MDGEIETSGSGTEERIVSSKVRAPISGGGHPRYIEEGVLVTSGISSFTSGMNLFQIAIPPRGSYGRTSARWTSERFMLIRRCESHSTPTLTRHSPKLSVTSRRSESFSRGRNVVSFNTEIEIIDKDPCLQPGMSCDVDVILARADSVLSFPRKPFTRRRKER